MDPPLTICSLFSGGAGLDLGIHRAVRNARTVVYVEREAYACAVLAARMAEGVLAQAPIWTDVTTFDGRPWRGLVDCVAFGSPCQDMSVAGNRAGLDGARSGLFFQGVRIVDEIRPEFVFWENVAGAASSLPRVFDAFAALGYSGAAVKLRASDVGASHQRARIFLLGRLADADRPVVRNKSGRLGGADGADSLESSDPRFELADSNGRGCEGERQPLHGRGDDRQPRNELDRQGRSAGMAGSDSGDARREGRERAGAPCEDAGPPRPVAERGRPEWPPGPAGDWNGIDARFYPAQPRVRGVADGVGGKLVDSVDDVWGDRLRLLGNGVVPACAAEAWRFLMEAIR